MEFYAFHGHYEEEQIVGNRFLVDLEMETDMEKAAQYLREKGVETVVIKHGGKGCYVSTDEQGLMF